MSALGYSVELKTPEEIERDVELKRAYQRGYEEGAKAERERVLDEFTQKIQQTYVGKYDNEAGDIPEIPIDELADIIQSLRSSEQKQLSTAVEDITPEGAAIVQKYKEQTRRETIEEIYRNVIPYCDPMTEDYLESLRSGERQEREPE